jgi:N-acetylglucosamine-6-phosphate deacetylase
MRFIAAHYRTGKHFEFQFKGTRMMSRGVIRASKRKPTLLFGPSLFDIQCNGFAGVDFNNPETTPTEINAAITAMSRFGTLRVFPTIITGGIDRMTRCLRSIHTSCVQYPSARKAILGIHLEGPFLSRLEGYRGAHSPTHVRRPSLQLVRRLQDAAAGKIRMITMAPELPGALKLIRQLKREGILVALGHTSADARCISQAVEAGAILSTHLGNATPSLLPRHANTVFAQLAEDRLGASFIPDGLHLPAPVLKTFLRAKSPGRIIFTTDSMAAAGAPPGVYTLGNLSLRVSKDRVVRFPGGTNFAGSSLTLNQAVANAVTIGGLAMADAWDAASIIPSSTLGFAPPPIESTFVVASFGKHFQVKAAISDSQLLHMA